MFSLINRECLCERGDCTLRSDVCRTINLSHRANETRQVDDVAFRLPQMRQGKLAGSEDANNIQIQQTLKLFN
jgi:hypothetical protein